MYNDKIKRAEQLLLFKRNGIKSEYEEVHKSIANMLASLLEPKKNLVNVVNLW